MIGDKVQILAMTIAAHKHSPYFVRKPNVVAKRTVKYLAVCDNPTTYRSVARGAPDSAIKAICNAALNVERGDVCLSKGQKTLFRRHRAQIARLTSPRVSLKTKRHIIEQKGSGFFIPAIISALSGIVGSLFGGNKQ